MTQLTINVEDKAILPHLKKILNAIEGVSIEMPQRKRKNGLDKALDDVKTGRTKRFDTLEEFFDDLGI